MGSQCEGTGAQGAQPQQCCLTHPAARTQELTLEEYEKQQAEKRAALNKPTTEVKAIKVDEEFKGMKVRDFGAPPSSR